MLELGIWSFSGVWILVFGVFILVFCPLFYRKSEVQK